MTSSQQERDKALKQVSDHSPEWKARALQEMRWMRSNRLFLESKYQESFTFEDLLSDLEYLIGRAIPHHNLAGAVVMDSIRKGIIEETSVLSHTKGEEKHKRRAMTYRWKPELPQQS